MIGPHPIDVFHAGIQEGVFPGGQLAASREGKRLALVSGGRLGPDLEPTTSSAVYDLASLTKPLATTLLLGRALENGRCNLLDPISKFVPGTDPGVNLEHLLEHAAGYPAHIRYDQRLPPRLVPGSWNAWRYIVLDAARTPRESPPGRRAVYSDVGFILLGAALEVLFGRPLSQAFSELRTDLFFRDLRGPPAPPLVRPQHPIAPTENGLVGLVHDENCRAMGGAAGHAGLFGHAEGVLKLCESLVRAWHGGKRELLTPETVQRLWAPSLVPDSTRTLGWDRPSAGGSSTGGCWPAHAVGHLGFTGTSVWIEPESALIVVLVTNRVCPSRRNEEIRRLRPRLYSAAWAEWSEPKLMVADPPTDPSAPVAVPYRFPDDTEAEEGPPPPKEDPITEPLASGEEDAEPTTRLDTPS